MSSCVAQWGPASSLQTTWLLRPCLPLDAAEARKRRGARSFCQRVHAFSSLPVPPLALPAPTHLLGHVDENAAQIDAVSVQRGEPGCL